MKKLFAIVLITAATLGLSGCTVFSYDGPRHRGHAHVVHLPPRPPRAVVVVPGPAPHHHPPGHPHRGD